jgi:hypothetical protein
MLTVSQINPITGAAVGGSGVQRAQSADKAAQLRRAAAKKSGSSSSNSDTFEPQITNAHELEPIGDEHHQNRGGNRNAPKKPAKPAPAPTQDGESNLDLKA